MKLDAVVAGLVLVSALLHASWNALVKSDADRLASFALVQAVGFVIGVAALPFTREIAPEARPYLVASVVVHHVYYFFLLRSYAHGDLSHVYPIARGIGPVVVAALSASLAGERLTAGEAAGVALVSLGIASLAVGRTSPLGTRWQPNAYAAATGLAIGMYTIVDGLGARRSGHALSYVAWLMVLDGPWVFLLAALLYRGSLLTYARARWWRGAGGGVIASLGYGIAVWALSRAAMAHVAALRETSVLFAAVMGTMLLGEPFGARRIAAAILVAGGLVMMNVST